MAEKDPKDPTNTSGAYDRMAPLWNKISTVLAGTEALRAARTTYLPQHAGEDKSVYEERLQTNVLTNITELTLNHWVGKPFSEPMQLVESSDDEEAEPPAQLQEIAEDVDLEGSGLSVFARQWFREGLAKAFSHVLVDFPRRKEKPDGTPRTLADDMRENLRPYWVHIPPERIVALYTAQVNGKEQPTHVRILEDVVEHEGFLEVTKQRVREFNLVGEDVGQPTVYVRLWELQQQDEHAKEEWVVIDEYTMDRMTEIPLVTFYADREAVMVGKPPLLDLVNLNIRHWQSSSDQFATLTAARFPMLAGSGVSEHEKNTIQIGPRKALISKKPESKWYYVEHSGAAIGVGRQELQDLEAQMQAYGAQFMTRRTGNQTATERAIDSAETTSSLQDAVTRFEDSVNQVLEYTMMWLGTESTTKAQITADLSALTQHDQVLEALEKARKRGDITQRTFLLELQRRGLISEDVKIDDEVNAKEQNDLALPKVEPDPGRDDGDEDEEEQQ